MANLLNLTRPDCQALSIEQLKELSTVGDYQLSVSLPINAFIREFVAAFNGSDWTVSVVTTKDQVALIKDREGRPMRFHSLDSVARFLAEQGATELSVFLLGLTNGGAN